MMTRQMLSTVSSGRRPRWRSARLRIIDASRAGRKADPPPWRALISMSWSMMRPRSISNSCIAESIRSISDRSPASVGSGDVDTGKASQSAFAQSSRRKPVANPLLKRLGVHRLEEIGVCLGLAQLPEQEFDRVDGSHRVQNAAQHVHFLENVRRDEQLFLASARARDVHRGKSPFVSDLPVEDDF